MAAPADSTNAAQARAWNGDDGAYWAAHHQTFEAALDRYDPAFFTAAAIRATDRVLDVGCGTGGTTRAAARQARVGHALGLDLSAPMIAVARDLAAQEGLGNVAFEWADAQVHPLGAAAYDVAISKTGAMFFGRPDQAFVNLRRSLVPGGRLVLLTWQAAARQEWLQAFSVALTGRTPPAPPADDPGPFSLSDPGRVRRLLRQAGFDHVDLTPLTERTTYGPTVDRAHEFVLGLLGWMLDGLDAERRARAAQDLRSCLDAHLTDDGVRFDSAAWLVTATRGT